MLKPTDPGIEVYIREIRGKRGLSQEEEIRLVRLIKQGSAEAAQKLVESNLLFVVGVAKRYEHRGLPFSDLIQEGNMGLITAARKFDEKRKVKFITYAVHWVRQIILKALAEQRSDIKLTIGRSRDWGLLVRAEDRLTGKLGRRPTVEEVLQEAKITSKHFLKLRENFAPIRSLDEEIREGLTLGRVLTSDDKSNRADDEWKRKEALLLLEQALDNLKAMAIRRGKRQQAQRLRTVVVQYLMGDGKGNLKVIGEQFGITKEMIRVDRDFALELLRRQLDPHKDFLKEVLYNDGG